MKIDPDHILPNRYTHVVFVSGNRFYDDYHEFKSLMLQWLAQHANINGRGVVMINKEYRSGVDQLTIRFCKEYGIDYACFTANYNKYGRAATAWCNFAMLRVSTHVVVIIDDDIPVKEVHVARIAIKANLKTYVYVVKRTPVQEVYDECQKRKRSSRRNNPEVHRKDVARVS